MLVVSDKLSQKVRLSPNDRRSTLYSREWPRWRAAHASVWRNRRGKFAQCL